MKNKALEFIKINFWSLLGMLIGLIVIIVGFTFDSYSIGSSSMAFGADFYTEMYQVTREAGISIQNRLVDIATLSFVFGGLIDICAFGSKLKMPKEEIASNSFTESTTNASIENTFDVESNNTAN